MAQPQQVSGSEPEFPGTSILGTDFARRPVPRHQKVSDVVAHRIVDDALGGGIGLTNGTRLPRENVMMERYGVGRGSLREALRILEVYGFVRIKAGKGGGPIVTLEDISAFASTASFYFRVAGVTLDEVLKANCKVEPMLARIAAEELTDQTAEIIQQAIDDEVQEQELPSFIGASHMFDLHASIAKTCRNPVLSLLGVSILHMKQARFSAYLPFDDRALPAADHKGIAAAIFARDGDRAEMLMRRHSEAVLFLMRRHVPGLLSEVIGWY